MKEIKDLIDEIDSKINELERHRGELIAAYHNKVGKLREPFLDCKKHDKHISLADVHNLAVQIDRNAMFGKRVCGDFKGRGIFLGIAYEDEKCPWTIIQDDEYAGNPSAWVLTLTKAAEDYKNNRVIEK